MQGINENGQLSVSVVEYAKNGGLLGCLAPLVVESAARRNPARIVVRLLAPPMR